MASKQLGKLRQWGREVISSKDKTVVSEEFKQVERDVDLRRIGIERLQASCSEYHGYLHKKKEYPSVEEGVKMLPVDALGAVMMSHGEEFGQDSAFGQNLIKMGRAHCKIATLQETFASTFRDTYLTSLNEMLESITEYSAQRRKLESRRLTYDAAMTKASKAKKEKEMKEAEEEVEVAKKRYEETSVDVRSRMRDIQDNEIRQLRDLTEFLTLEIDFAMQYLSILKATQEDWVDETRVQRQERQPEISAPHAFAYGRSAPSISTMSSISKTTVPARSSSAGSRRTSEDDENRTKQSTLKRRSLTATPPPRPSSRNSVGSTGTAHDARRRSDSVESEGASNSKRMNVTGWASSAVSSFSRKDPKKEKVKDKDKNATRAFANLENESDDSRDDDEASLEPELRSRSLSSFGTSALSKMLGQGSRSSSQSNTFSSSNSSFNSFSGNKTSTSTSSRRVMCAMYDYDGSNDQLTFKAGDEIIVIYEGRDGWSMGELAGQRGLFPTSYVGDLQTRSRPPPLLPVRQTTTLAHRAQIETASEDDMSIRSEALYSPNSNLVTPGLYNEPFGKFQPTKSPATFDDNINSLTDNEDEERQGLFKQPETPAFFDSPVEPSENDVRIGNKEGNAISQAKQPPILPRRSSTKRAPPPPPARRTPGSSSATTNSNTAPPQASIPAPSVVFTPFPPPPSIPRRPKATSAVTDHDLTVSPFDN